jgi:uncharacterized protein (TIGR03437 family)
MKTSGTAVKILALIVPYHRKNLDLRKRHTRSLRTASVHISARTTLAITWLATASCLLAQVPGYTITTVALPSTTYPGGLAIDASGNLYLADIINYVVRKVSTTGVVSTVAGGGGANATSPVGDGGPATSASLSEPLGIAVDTAGNLYIADTGHNRIRKVSAGGTITTVAGPGSTDGALGDGGPATSATLVVPEGICVDAAGNLYIADSGHDRIRKVSLDGTIATVAGNGSASGALGDGGPATSASLSLPAGITVDAGGTLYIADSGHNRIRTVSLAGGITTVAGNGAATYSGDGGLAIIAAIRASALTFEFNFVNYYAPLGVAVGPTGNLYLTDNGNNRLRVVTTDGKINTLAGNGTVGLTSSGDGGAAFSAGLPQPVGIALGSNGAVYVSDYQAVRLLTPSAIPVFPAPSIAARGVVSASGWGSFSQLAQGSWMSIYGSYLSTDSRGWAGADFTGVNAPISLDGTSVTIGGQPAFISYISPGQLNAQVPTNSGTGAQPLIVSTSSGNTATYTVTVNGSEPGLLAPASFDIGSVQYAAALFPDGATYVLPSGAITGVPSRPASAGNTITLYGIGFGPVTPDTPAGEIVQTSNTLALPFKLSIGGTEATVAYAGLAPGEVGLYQFNVIVPKLSSTGPARLTFTLDGVAETQVLYISTQ